MNNFLSEEENKENININSLESQTSDDVIGNARQVASNARDDALNANDEESELSDLDNPNVDIFTALGGMAPDSAFDVKEPASNNIETREIGFGEKIRLGMEAETGEHYSTGEAVAARLIPFAAKYKKSEANERIRALESIVDGTAFDDINSVPQGTIKKYGWIDGSKSAEEAKERLLRQYIDIIGGNAKNYLSQTKMYRDLSPDDKLKELRPFAESALKNLINIKRSAQNTLTNTTQGTWSKIGTGIVENTGYTLEFVVGTVLAGGHPAGGFVVAGTASAAERASSLSTNDYEIDEYGNLVNLQNAYSEEDAFLKGVTGGFTEAGVETALGWGVGKLGGVVVKGIAKVPGAKYIGNNVSKLAQVTKGKLSHVPGAQMLAKLGRGYSSLSHITGQHEIPMELLEENVQSFFDDVVGLAAKKGEYEGFGKEWENYKRDTLNWDTQRDILLGMVGTMVLQGAGGAYLDKRRRAPGEKKVADAANEKAVHYSPKEARGRLELLGFGDKLDSLSDSQAVFLANLSHTMERFTPEELLGILSRQDVRVQGLAAEIAKKYSWEYDQQLAELGESAEFTPDNNSDGLVNTLPGEYTDDNGNKHEARVILDTAHGVGIRNNMTDEGDAFTVVDNRGNEIGVSSMESALIAANMLVKQNAVKNAENKQKAEHINQIIAQNFGTDAQNKFQLRNTWTEFIDEMRANGASEEVIQRFRQEQKKGTPGVRLDDGRVFLFLDNVTSPMEAAEVLQHEVIGHDSVINKLGGKEGVIKFLRSLDSKTMRDYTATVVSQTKQRMLNHLKRQGVAITPELEAQVEQDAMKWATTDEGIQEIFARIVERRRHNPAIWQKLAYRMRERAREKGANKPINDNDLEVILSQMEKESGKVSFTGQISVVPSMSVGGMTFLRFEDNTVPETDADVGGVEGGDTTISDADYNSMVSAVSNLMTARDGATPSQSKVSEAVGQILGADSWDEAAQILTSIGNVDEATYNLFKRAYGAEGGASETGNGTAQTQAQSEQAQGVTPPAGEAAGPVEKAVSGGKASGEVDTKGEIEKLYKKDSSRSVRGDRISDVTARNWSDLDAMGVGESITTADGRKFTKTAAKGETDALWKGKDGKTIKQLALAETAGDLAEVRAKEEAARKEKEARAQERAKALQKANKLRAGLYQRFIDEWQLNPNSIFAYWHSMGGKLFEMPETDKKGRFINDPAADTLNNFFDGLKGAQRELWKNRIFGYERGGSSSRGNDVVSEEVARHTNNEELVNNYDVILDTFLNEYEEFLKWKQSGAVSREEQEAADRAEAEEAAEREFYLGELADKEVADKEYNNAFVGVEKYDNGHPFIKMFSDKELSKLQEGDTIRFDHADIEWVVVSYDKKRGILTVKEPNWVAEERAFSEGTDLLPPKEMRYVITKNGISEYKEEEKPNEPEDKRGTSKDVNGDEQGKRGEGTPAKDKADKGEVTPPKEEVKPNEPEDKAGEEVPVKEPLNLLDIVNFDPKQESHVKDLIRTIPNVLKRSLKDYAEYDSKLREFVERFNEQLQKFGYLAEVPKLKVPANPDAYILLGDFGQTVEMVESPALFKIYGSEKNLLQKGKVHTSTDDQSLYSGNSVMAERSLLQELSTNDAKTMTLDTWLKKWSPVKELIRVNEDRYNKDREKSLAPLFYSALLGSVEKAAILKKYGISAIQTNGDSAEKDVTPPKDAGKKTAREAEKAPTAAKEPSVKMKDEAAEKRAKDAEAKLAGLFSDPDYAIIGANEKKYNSYNGPQRMVDEHDLPFTSFLRSHNIVGLDRENGTPIESGVVRDAFEAFENGEAQRKFFYKVFEVAEKLGCTYKVDYSNRSDTEDKLDKKEFAYELGGRIVFHVDRLDRENDETIANTILHELIHGVTSYAIDISENQAGVEGVTLPTSLHNAVRKLRATYKLSKPFVKGTYEATNIHEFVAGLSDPAFRRKLDQKNLLRRALDAIVDIFRALFGRPATTKEAVNSNRALKALHEFLENFDRTAFETHRNAADEDASRANYAIDQDKRELFQKRAGAVMEIIEVYRDSGVAEFKTLATRMFEGYPDKFENMKSHLRGIWNYIAEQEGLDEVSKDEANRIYDSLSVKPEVEEIVPTEPKAPPSNKLQSTRISDAADEIVALLEKGKPFTRKQITDIVERQLDGKVSKGDFDAKQVTDILELAINRYIKSKDSIFSPSANVGSANAVAVVNRIRNILDIIPTQTTRSVEQDRLQQFSTPPHEGFVAAWVANISNEDVMLEPSAGIGGLAVFADVAGAKVILNEYSPRRGEILEELGLGKPYSHDAQYLYALLEPDIKSGKIKRPTVVVMNPPFSNSASSGKKDTHVGAEHVEQAIKLLAPGGRLVAIVGNGMDHSKPAFKAWWNKIGKEYTVRANIGVNGQEYSKYGTSFDNNIIVIDKVAPNGSITPIYGKINSIDELPSMLEGVRNDRPKVNNTRNEQVSTVQSGGESTSTNGSNSKQGGVASSRTTGSETSTGGTRTSERVSGRRTQSESPASTQVGKKDNASDDGRGLQSGGVARDGRGDANGLADKSNTVGGVQSNEVSTDAGLAVQSVEQTREVGDGTFSEYKPSKVSIQGMKPHPTALVESSAMASVQPPNPTYSPKIPKNFIEDGTLSEAQIEQVVYAGQSHEQKLGNGERKGYFIGDGTGVGKGREISGVILDNFNNGRKKAVWISKTSGLANDAKRDLTPFGLSEELFTLETKNLKGMSKRNHGIAFTTYSSLAKDHSRVDDNGNVISTKQNKKSRMQAIVEWLGRDFDGVIVFDESHLAGNAVAIKGKRGLTKPSQQALAVVDIQKALPNARILYVSATGATEVNNLAYATRLGLWGKGSAFKDRDSFITQVSNGGISVMEIVARDMKAMGVYMARTLSYEGIENERITHELSPDQIRQYNLLAETWQMVMEEVENALVSSNGINGKAKGAVMSAFWGAHQRFFNQTLTAMQMPTVLAKARELWEGGYSPVFQIVSTNEAAQNRAIEKSKDEGGDIDVENLDLSPRDILIGFVENSFPTVQYVEMEDDSGKPRWVPLVGANGEFVQDPVAVERKERLLGRLQRMKMGEAPLDMILNEFGHKNVAEVTGRSARREMVRNSDGEMEMKIVRRTKNNAKQEADEFNDGERTVLVFSGAGNTGFSFHADRKFKNQRRRVQFMIEAGYNAASAIQGLGRTHRANESSHPLYMLCSTNLPGHKRFMSTIARRLAQLGSLTSGDRSSSGSGVFSEADNLENQYAKNAVLNLFEEMFLDDRAKFNDICKEMGFMKPVVNQETGERSYVNSLIDSEGDFDAADKLDIPHFLNRILAMKIDAQNELFDAFSNRMAEMIERAKDAGTFDPGMEKLKGETVEVKNRTSLWQDANNIGHTDIVEVVVTKKSKKTDYATAFKRFVNAYGREPQVYVHDASGSIVMMVETNAQKTQQDGSIVNVYKQLKPNGDTGYTTSTAVAKNYTPLANGEAQWEDELNKVPELIEQPRYFAHGTLLPIWDKLGSPSPRFFKIVPTGGNEMQSFLGMEIDADRVNDVLARFGKSVGSVVVTPEVILKRITKEGKKVELQNGWTLKRVKVLGDNRIEIDGVEEDSDIIRLASESYAYAEKIGHFRIFVKPDADSIAAFLEDYPAVPDKGGLNTVTGSSVDTNGDKYKTTLNSLFVRLRNAAPSEVDSIEEAVKTFLITLSNEQLVEVFDDYAQFDDGVNSSGRKIRKIAGQELVDRKQIPLRLWNELTDFKSEEKGTKASSSKTNGGGLYSDPDFALGRSVIPAEYREVYNRYHNADGTAKAGYHKAPNGKKSNLTEMQWNLVRTPSFKKWFGDWEALLRRKSLDATKAVAVKAGAFIRQDGNTVQQTAKALFSIAREYSTEVGKVTIDARSAHTSLSHGYSQKKLDALVSIQDDFSNAVYIGSEPDFNGKDIINHYFAYPIEYGERKERNYVFCRAREDKNLNRLYLHEVLLESDIKNKGDAFQTAAASSLKDASHTNASPVKKPKGAFTPNIILQRLFAVNPDSVSKVVDENGEPLVVYHGAREYFTNFHISSKGKYGAGIYVSPLKEKAERYSRIKGQFGYGNEIVMPLFVNIINPAIAIREGQRYRIPSMEGKDGLFTEPLAMDSVEIVALDPTQIKSATDNTGAFDGGNPDIRFADPDYKLDGNGITNAEQDAAQIERGLKAPKKRYRGDEAVMRGAEEIRSNAEFTDTLARVLRKNPRAILAEENIALAQEWLKAKDEYDDVVYSIAEATREGDAAAVRKMNARKRELEGQMATIIEAREKGVGEAARTLRTNRFLFKADYSLAGLVAQATADLGRPLTDIEYTELKDIADKLAKLDEQERDMLIARIKAYADKAIKGMIAQDKVDSIGKPRTTNEMRRMLRKRNDALAQIEVLAFELGGEINALIPTGEDEDFESAKFLNLRKYLRGLAQYHVYHNPNITEQELIAALIEDIAPYFTVDADTVRQIFSGYGHSWNVDRTEIQRKVSDLSAQSRILQQIADYKAGELAKLTGPQRSEPSDEVRELTKIRDQLRRQMEREGKFNDQGKHLKTLLDSAKTRYTNMINDIKAALDAGVELQKREPLNVSDAELDALKAEYAKLKEEYDAIWGSGSKMTDEQKRQMVEKGLKRALERWVDKLERAQRGDFSSDPKAPKVTSADIEALRKKIKEHSEEWNKLKAARSVEEWSDEELLAYAQRRLEAVNRALRHWQTVAITGDIAPKKKKDIPFPNDAMRDEYERIQEQRNRAYRQILDMREHLKNKETPLGLGYAKEYALFVSNFMRSLLATADFSAMMRQTAPMTMAHPLRAVKTLFKTFSAMMSSSKAMDIDKELRNNPLIREALNNKWLEWRALEGSGGSDDVEMFHGIDAQAITIGKKKDGTERRIALGDIKGLGTVLHASERQYATFINMFSADLYIKMCNSPIYGKNGPTDAQKQMIAAAINMSNGSAQLGAKGKQAMAMLTQVFWAPKLAVSRAQVAVGGNILYPFLSGKKNDATTKERGIVSAQMAFESIRAWLGAAAAGWLMLSLFGDDDEKEYVEQAEGMSQLLMTMRPRIGSTKLDFTGGVAQWWQLMQMAVTGVKETATGKKIDLANTYGRSKSGELWRFLQGKLNPVASNTIALWEGKDFVGNEFGFSELAKNSAIPLAGRDIWEAASNEKNGLGRGLLMAPFILIGAGGTTYDIDRSKGASNKSQKSDYDVARAEVNKNRDKKVSTTTEHLAKRRVEKLFERAHDTEQIIKRREKKGLQVPQSLRDRLERQKAEALEAFRSSR